MAWPSQIYFATVDLGIYYTSDFVDPAIQPTWAAINGGLPTLLCREFELDYFHQVDIQYVLMMNETVYRRIGGENWVSILTPAQAAVVCGTDNTDPEIRSIWSDTAIEGRLWALFRDKIAYQFFCFAMKSDDYGTTWTHIHVPVGGVLDIIWGINAHRDNLFVTVSDRTDTIYYSANFGGAWVSEIAGTGYELNYNILTPDKIWCRHDADDLGLYDPPAAMVTKQVNIHPSRRDSMWFDPTDANHQRMWHGTVMYTTANGWTNANNNGGVSDDPYTFCPRVNDNDIDQMLVGIMTGVGNYSIGALYGEADTVTSRIGGTNFAIPPYTDSVPHTCGGACYRGIRVAEIEPGSINTYAVAMPGYSDTGLDRGVPMAGERGAWDALNYPLRHTDDIDIDVGIHHTLGAGSGQASPGDHTHLPSSAIEISSSKRLEENLGSLLLLGDKINIVDDTHNNAFPGACIATDGTIIVVYRDGTNHGTSKGIIKKRTSTDGGATWSAESTVYSDATYDARDPCITRLHNGNLIVSFKLYDHIAPDYLLDACHIIISTDNGATWSADIDVPTGFTDHDGCSAPVIEMRDDRLLLPSFGLDTGDTYEYARLSESIDGGATWNAVDVIAKSAVRHYQEPNLLLLKNGRLICMMRSDTAFTFWRTESLDFGGTWETEELQFTASGCPRMTEATNGAVVIIYRQKSVATNYPAYRISLDGCEIWSVEDTIEDTALMVYASGIEYETGLIGIVYGLENPVDDTNSDLFWTHIAVQIQTGQFVSKIPTGDAPLVVDSTTLVTNLNVDQVDGEHIQKRNMNAGAAPGVGDDANDGYAVGSRWFDTTNDKEYVCLDATVGAAVWIETTSSGGALALDDLTDVNAPAPADQDVLTWDDGAGEWIPQAPPAGGVVDAADVTYTPAVVTDWDGDADPGNADAAFDQLAERVDDLEIGGGVGDGWISASGTWTYSSADAPTYVISVNNDQTAIICVGMRINLTHGGSVKYFIVTAVGAYSGGATLITVYGGTDYTLAAGAITLPYYSMMKTPFGFPLNPTKWTVELKHAVTVTQNNPVDNTWYNAESITIPIGEWNVTYHALLHGNHGSATTIYCKLTLSTANNSESDTEFTCAQAGNAVLVYRTTVTRSKILSLAAKTVYYLNMASNAGSIAAVAIINATSPCIIRAVCAYL